MVEDVRALSWRKSVARARAAAQQRVRNFRLAQHATRVRLHINASLTTRQYQRLRGGARQQSQQCGAS